MNVTGTIQQVFDALDKANPNFRHDFGIANKSVLPATAESSSSYEVEKVICTGFDYARKDATQDGIKHLNSVPGAPANGPGPGNCGRVSCSYDSAIYWCNDVGGIFVFTVMEMTLQSSTRLLTFLIAL